jgi:ferredoxin
MVDGKVFGADCYSCARCLSLCPEEAISYGSVFAGPSGNGKELVEVSVEATQPVNVSE